MITPNKARLGRLASLDLRDHAYSVPLVRRPAGVTQRTWNDREVWDQGESSECVAFASMMFLRAGPVQNVDGKAAACDEFYRACQAVDEWAGTPHDGTSVRASFKVLQARGYVPEYRWAWDVTTVANWILARGPMVFGTTWTNQMFDPDKRGFLTVGTEPAGGHSYLGIGVNTTLKCPDGTLGAVRILNSWGTGWGQKGRAWLPFSQLKILLAEDGEAACGTEVVRKAAPGAA